MNNKAILLRSVSAIATVAASTAGGMQHANAQVLSPGANGYYYSVSGGLMFSSSEKYLAAIEDKVGVDQLGSQYSSYSSGFSAGGSTGISSYSAGAWSSYSSSYSSSGLSGFAGLFGSVSFGKQLDPNWDIRGTITGVDGGSNSGYVSADKSWWDRSYYSSFNAGSSYTYSSFNSGYASAWADGTYSFGYLAADLEIGYTPVLSDNFNVRLFAGLRALAFRSSFEGSAGEYNYDTGTYSSFSSDFGSYSGGHSGYFSSYSEGTIDVTFKGIGPRVGAQVATRFEGTNFGLSGSVASSVLFGQKTVTTSGWSEFYSSYSSYDSDFGSTSGSSSNSGYSSSAVSTNATVVDVQASVGVDYYLNDNTALTVGYQAEKLWEVNGEDLGPGTAIDTLTHGAFVKLSGTF